MRKLFGKIFSNGTIWLLLPCKKQLTYVNYMFYQCLTTWIEVLKVYNTIILPVLSNLFMKCILNQFQGELCRVELLSVDGVWKFDDCLVGLEVKQAALLIQALQLHYLSNSKLVYLVQPQYRFLQFCCCSAHI